MQRTTQEFITLLFPLLFFLLQKKKSSHTDYKTTFEHQGSNQVWIIIKRNRYFLYWQLWLRTSQALGSPGIVASDGSYVRLLEGSALVWKLLVVSGLWGCSQLPGRICIRFWLNCTDKESGLIFINGKGGNKTFYQAFMGMFGKEEENIRS